MILIVICHVVAGLSGNSYFSHDDYVFRYYLPSNDISHVLLSYLHQMGLLGNTVFFTVSAWFLLDNSRIKAEKIMGILLDREIVSVIFLLAGLIITSGGIDRSLAVKMLFPHTFRLFWYLTCYILFYLIHPALNLVIKSMSQRSHLIFVVISSSLFIFYSFFIHWYYSNVLISWVVLYFLIGYIKKYIPDRLRSRTTVNVFLLVAGFAGSILIIIISNIVCLNVESLSEIGLSYFDEISVWNPFHIMISIALMNIALKLPPQNIRFINYASSL
ncbi:MAG: acyltransferase family protein [Lachnospiraceae bacterium]|nr:acyltransferase family protein [Lachnospiraceae bacterium]